jgi:ADP-heptose:LPS heptosyltransferase
VSRSTGCRDCLGRFATKLPGRGSSCARLLDRYLGIPLVFLTGQFRRKRAIPARVCKIGLLNTAALGDTILMSGPLADLRAAYPHAQIIFLTGPSNYEAACLLDGPDEVVELPVFRPLAAIKAVRELELDLFLDFGPWCRLNALIAICSGAEFIGGFRTRAQARHFAYDLVVDHSENAHELENHRGLVRALGISPVHPPKLRCEKLESQNIHDLNRGFAVFSSVAWRQCGKAQRVGGGTMDRACGRFRSGAIRGGVYRAANQRALNDSVIAEVKPSLRPRMRNAAGASLRETLRLVSRAELVVSVDTGVMHMAAAVGVPLVALHGPTSPQRWGPVSENALVVEPLLRGCGFLNLGFEKMRQAPECMKAISYGTVKAACDAALNKGRMEPPPGTPMHTTALGPLIATPPRADRSASLSRMTPVTRELKSVGRDVSHPLKVNKV